LRLALEKLRYFSHHSRRLSFAFHMNRAATLAILRLETPLAQAIDESPRLLTVIDIFRFGVVCA
jgi:hypothetical protein